MRLFYKTKKLLLIAATMFSTGMAFAQEYCVVWSQDFENADTYTEGWTISGTPNWNTFNNSHYLHLYGITGSTSFAENSTFTSADDYIFEFDWNAGQGNGSARLSTLTITADNESGTLFYVNAGSSSAGWNSDAAICNSAGETLATTTVDGYKKASAFTFMFHFTIQGNSEGVTLTVTKSDGTTVLEETKISESLCHVTGITASAHNKAACMGVDNLSLSVLGASEGITTPSCAITATYNENRTITVIPGVGTEGTIAESTYYTTDGTEPSKENGTAYTQPFTISETSTIKVISYLPDGTASEVFTLVAEAGTWHRRRPSGYGSGLQQLGCPTLDLRGKVPSHQLGGQRVSGFSAPS